MRSLITFCIVLLSLFFSSGARAATTITSHAEFIGATCGTVYFYVYTAGCSSSNSVRAYYGDGGSGTFVDSCSFGTGMANFSHTYSSSGTYTVKLVAINSGIAEDSVTFSLTVNFCRQLPVTVYNDVNSNCICEPGTDLSLHNPTILAVDSAGVPIDTISTLHSIWYTAYGPVGTVYGFRVLTAPSGMTNTCPSSGIVYSTVPPTGTAATEQFLGFECISTTAYDLSLSATFSPAIAGSGANKATIVIYNTNCAGTATPAILKFDYSPKYTFGTIYPSTYSYTVTGTSVSVNVGTVSPSSARILSIKLTPVVTLSLGDTVNSRFSVAPTSGDIDTANNVVIRCDTVRAAYDPNQKSVTPSGNISAGTRLEYLLEFENQGNDTAYNIHILDTLSDYLDVNSIQMKGSTHSVSLIKYVNAGKTILKFDFADIRLPDSSHHDYCRGSVAFSINAKSTLALGTVIPNRVGIYFDTNPVIMTNTVFSKIPLPTGLVDSKLTRVELYPNPVTDILHIATDGNYNSLTIYNMMGQVVASKAVDKGAVNIDVRSLVPGIYYTTLKGADASKSIKFQKQ